ncbi:uncharacterized protein LOC125602324 [Brassica napus]|uniref:uncharacterized protein LOC125602324 n=1 Tax=Brassica napus TaxID=3708 RepID=UPI0020789D2F|nr:uncharacterized protein LOC125602324 [Brassica napus]
MNADCERYVRKCDKCQRHASTLHSPTQFLHTLTAPYPFMRWGMDIIGPMPASRQKKFILVLTDYFTKWVEAEAYASITDKESNGQAESTNKTIIDGLKKRLDLKKGCWADELDGVLWSHKTTPRGATKATPFSMAYGVEAMAPAEVNVTSCTYHECHKTSNSTVTCCSTHSTTSRKIATKHYSVSKITSIKSRATTTKRLNRVPSKWAILF